MRRFTISLAVALLLGLASGCATSRGDAPGTALPTSTGAGTSTGPSTGTTTGPTPSGLTGEYRVTYGWAVPATTVTVDSPVPVPLTGPPGLPLPYLVEIRTGDHPGESPGYGRISFYFRGAFPGYRFEYTRQVVSDGRGDPVPLEGNAFLHIVFNPAQAHDDAGGSTVRFAAPLHVGFSSLRGYAPAGDYEGYVSFGLGIAVAPGSDQVRPIRVGELRRSDGFFIVAVDVQA